MFCCLVGFFTATIWGNGFKLKEGCCRLDARNKFFTVGVVTHGHRLLREVIDAPSVGAFKAKLEGILSSLI